jgi:dTDP-4-amino-4,6-dideoxygalactose transaminase
MSGSTTRLAPIPFAPPHITEDDIAAVAEVMRSGWLSTGSVCAALEAELGELVDAPHVVAMSSCTAALEIALRSLRLQPGQRVGVPTWTFVASASTVVHAGGIPVLIDVDEDTLNLSPTATEAAIAEGLDALVVVHFGGVAVDSSILAMAADAGIPVIEDAAHALGTTDDRGPISGRGTVGACYSFYATKNLTSGEGGALATHDADLAAFARAKRLHGLTNNAWDRYRVGANPSYDVEEPGLKANLPDMLAALARSQLARFGQMQARRRRLVDRYRAALDSVDGCHIVPGKPDERSADHLMVVVLPAEVDRGEVSAAMADAGVGTSIHFRPVHTLSWFRDNAQIGPTGLGVAESLASRTLSLPLHAGLEDHEVDRVVESLVSALP